MIINGKEISQKIKDDLKEKVIKIKENYSRLPKLTVIVVGNNKASQVYVRNKERACNYIGIESQIIRLPEDSRQEDLLAIINDLNEDKTVDGILVQLPLPKQINKQTVIDKINPQKDVDGFHPENIAKLFLGEPNQIPCTPKGMITLLEAINFDLTGKKVVVIGRSNIVGKPIALLALAKNATVTIAHSKTENLKEITKQADLLITAIGKARMITADYIKEGAVVLDVGINHDPDGKLCGDVDFDNVVSKAAAITPVPGGIGPMTIAMLLTNTLDAFYQHQEA